MASSPELFAKMAELLGAHKMAELLGGHMHVEGKTNNVNVTTHIGATTNVDMGRFMTDADIVEPVYSYIYKLLV